MTASAADTSPVGVRLIAVGILRDDAGRYLICRMPADRGVFPGTWGLPGGGIEAGETAEQALRREVREELDLELAEVRPLFFSEGTYPKTFPNGEIRTVHMVFLLFACRVASDSVRLSPEFDAHAWVEEARLPSYELNSATVETFARLGLIPGTSPGAPWW